MGSAVKLPLLFAYKVAPRLYPPLARPAGLSFHSVVSESFIVNTCPALPAVIVVNSLHNPFHFGAFPSAFINNTCPAVPALSVVKLPSLFAYKKSPSLYDDILVPPFATPSVPVSFEAETVTIFASVTLASLILSVVTASSTIVNAETPVTSPVCVALVILAVLAVIAFA